MKMKTKSRLLQAFAAMASMCFAFGFCRLAAASPVKAEGTDITVQAGELVSVEGASVTAAMKNDSAATPYTGLAIESETPYSGEFNATFKGDNYFEFRFPGETENNGNTQTNANAGQFTFTITDAADPTEYFEVVIGPSTESNISEAKIYVKYKDEIRTINTYSSNATTPFREVEWKYFNHADILPGFNSDGYTGTYNNYLGIEWEGDVLEINAKMGNAYANEQYVTIAQFDMDEVVPDNEWDKSQCNLPKLPTFKENGYTVSFSSAYETGSDIIFTSINGQSLETASVSLSATQTAAYNGKLAQDGKVFAAHGTSGKLQTAYTYTVGQGKYGNETVFVKYDEESEVSVNTEKYGKQSVTVGGMSVDVHVVMGAAETVAVEGASVTAAKENASAATPYTGLAIESETPYSGEFNAAFKGDNYFEFRFPGETENGNADDGAFTFRIADAADPLQYFEVVIGPSTNPQYGQCRTYVKYGDQIRTWNTAGGGILKECQYGNQGITLPGFNSDGYTGTYNNYLGIEWEGDVLKVNAKLDGNYGRDKQYVTIAEFDGNAEQWNLPKLASFQKNGYTVSFSSEYYIGKEAKGSPIVFTAINGVALSETLYDGRVGKTEICNDRSEVINGVETVEYDYKAAAFDGFYANESVRLGSALFNGTIALDCDFDIDTARPGTYKQTVSYGGASAEYDIVVEYPEIQLKFADGGSNAPLAVKLGTPIAIDKSDIMAQEADGAEIWNDLKTEQISISVKGPDDADFTAYTSGYAFDKAGCYIIRYSVCGTFPEKVNFIDREINIYEEERAVITINSQLPDECFVHQKIVLPSASATKEGASLNVDVKVFFEGKQITVEDNAFVPSKAGEYTITYVADNAVEVLCITANPDNEKPVIDVDFSDKQVFLNTKVEILAASVSDNTNEILSYTVAVKFGTESVQTDGNTFVASEYGAYTISYTAVDSSGNLATRNFVVQVVENPDGDDNPGGGTDGNKGCGSVLTGFGIPGCAAVAISVVLLRKKRRTIGK